jgi:hypothetical protein
MQPPIQPAPGKQAQQHRHHDRPAQHADLPQPLAKRRLWLARALIRALAGAPGGVFHGIAWHRASWLAVLEGTAPFGHHIAHQLPHRLRVQPGLFGARPAVGIGLALAGGAHVSGQIAQRSSGTASRAAIATSPPETRSTPARSAHTALPHRPAASAPPRAAAR